jgi:predicted anti-sigma-YlaC factor YlaD
MNCQLCQKELEEYREGRLPEGIRAQVEKHLNNCKTCADIYNLESIAFKVFVHEKEIQSNPFLATRIMAQIKEMENKKSTIESVPAFQRIIKPALIGISVSVALFAGVIMGNLYSSGETGKAIPVEMAYMDDASMEAINLFSNE